MAHRLIDRYPDGQIVVDMAETSAAPLSPAQGLARVIRVFESDDAVRRSLADVE